MKPRLHAFALAALAVFLTAGPAAAQGGPPAGEPGQHTRVFRSLEDPSISSQPKECPFPGANLFLGATLWSMETRAGDSRVVNEAAQQIGTAAACGLITTAVIPGALVPFYIEFTLDQGPDKVDTFVALGGGMRPATDARPRRPPGRRRDEHEHLQPASAPRRRHRIVLDAPRLHDDGLTRRTGAGFRRGFGRFPIRSILRAGLGR